MSIQSNINSAITITAGAIGLASKATGRADYIRNKAAYNKARKTIEGFREKGGLNQKEMRILHQAGSEEVRALEAMQQYKYDPKLGDELEKLHYAQPWLKMEETDLPGEITIPDIDTYWSTRFDGEAYGPEVTSPKVRANQSATVALQEARMEKERKSGNPLILRSGQETGDIRRVAEVQPKEEK